MYKYRNYVNVNYFIHTKPVCTLKNMLFLARNRNFMTKKSKNPLHEPVLRAHWFFILTITGSVYKKNQFGQKKLFTYTKIDFE